MEKTCSICKSTKPIDGFQRDASRRDGRSGRCRDCDNLRQRNYRQTREGKSFRVQQVKRRKRRGLLWFDEYRRTHPCVFCGESEMVCLDLHHRDPSSKIKDVSRMVLDAWSLERVQAEIGKCVVLCANCHRKVHAGILEIEKELA